MTREQSILKLPVAVHVHHALMDGFHVSQFLERFQQALQDVPGTMGI
jgi:chloramphenicol O-acetyltransferase type A